MLPSPTLTFTIPSIQDDLPIECRIYHPTCLAPTSPSQLMGWRKRAAIVAHPYAPLGGCYDDPVVEVLASTILKEGFVVGTFNFRGAGSSKGRTTWQSKSEQNDYISFIGFMIFYIHHLSAPKPLYSSHDLSPVPSQVLPPTHLRDSEDPFSSPTSPGPSFNPSGIETLLLAGYSYGGLITTFLPSSLPSILTPFQNPTPLSAHASIRLRALHLATEQTTTIANLTTQLLQTAHQKRSRTLIDNPKTRAPGSVRVGGDEDIRRASHDSHRARNSFNLADTPERVRKSIDRVRSIARSQHRAPLSPRRKDSQGSISSIKSAHQAHTPPTSHSASSSIEILTPTTSNPTPPIPHILTGTQIAYLLVSPPINFLGTLATMWSHSRSRETESHSKLYENPTLALFGDDDIFVGVRRFRAWAEKLEGEKGRGGRGSGFRSVEVEGAGHFWHDRDAVGVLRGQVEGFVAGLCGR